MIWMIDYSLQSNRGAKNHAIVMPDASMDTTLNALVASGFGAAGQRCMAISTVVFVGGSNLWYMFCPLLSITHDIFVFYAAIGSVEFVVFSSPFMDKY